MKHGYAIINPQGEVIVNTISETERAAMVNALVTENVAHITAGWTDDEIWNVFRRTLKADGYRCAVVRIAIEGQQ
jgi:2-polyprenyl-3-methyl-5-hydroxy-6-metoxy-1,4-benzoquinol methylase